VAATPRNVFFIVRHKRLLCDARDRVESDGADRNLQNRNVVPTFFVHLAKGVLIHLCRNRDSQICSLRLSLS
jgi:hypothetical protein